MTAPLADLAILAIGIDIPPPTNGRGRMQNSRFLTQRTPRHKDVQANGHRPPAEPLEAACPGPRKDAA